MSRGRSAIEVFSFDNISDADTAVPRNGAFNFSAPQGGCGNPNCSGRNCPPGHWFTLLLPMNDHGVIYGGTLSFEHREDLIQFFERMRIVVDAYLEQL